LGSLYAGAITLRDAVLIVGREEFSNESAFLSSPIADMVGRQESVFDRKFDIEQVDILGFQQIDKVLGFILTEDKTDFNGEISRKLKEGLFMQDAMAAETCDSTHRRASMKTAFLGAFQQPFEKENSVVLTVFTDVELEKYPFHIILLLELSHWLLYTYHRLMLGEPLDRHDAKYNQDQ
jgi:hypothetical protein